MNAATQILSPLPAALRDPPRPSTARRRRIGDFTPDRRALDRFNRTLAQLQSAPVEGDQLASAARQLSQQAASGPQPDCIQQRLQQANEIGLMLDDRGWQPAADTAALAALVVHYVQSDRDLIPDCLARVGRLDDAIVVDAAWRLLGEEVDDYLDFRRVRLLEAELRECEAADFAFGRDDWKQARCAETAWIDHCRKAGMRSYLLSSRAPLFRIH